MPQSHQSRAESREFAGQRLGHWLGRLRRIFELADRGKKACFGAARIDAAYGAPTLLCPDRRVGTSVSALGSAVSPKSQLSVAYRTGWLLCWGVRCQALQTFFGRSEFADVARRGHASLRDRRCWPSQDGIRRMRRTNLGSVLAVRPGGSTSQPTDSPHPSSLRDIAPPIDGTHVFSLFVSMVQKSL